jgi:predicted RNA binding protein YcfA (HicA-like mRNA interferase family)
MSNNPAITYKEAVKVAKQLGFQLKSHAGTSHMQFKHPETKKKVTIPKYGKEVFGLDLISNICRQMGISKKTFFSLLKGK